MPGSTTAPTTVATETTEIETAIYHFKLVLIHQDAAARARGEEICTELADRFDDPVELKLHQWSFDDLQNPRLARVATLEATQADAVMFSTNAQDLPAALKRWVWNWLPGRQRRPGALVALLSPQTGADPRPFPAHTFLERIAYCARMDFCSNIGKLGASIYVGVAPVR